MGLVRFGLEFGWGGSGSRIGEGFSETKARAIPEVKAVGVKAIAKDSEVATVNRPTSLDQVVFEHVQVERTINKILPTSCNKETSTRAKEKGE